MSPVNPTVLDRFHTGELGFMVTSVRNGIHEALERELAPFELTTPHGHDHRGGFTGIEANRVAGAREFPVHRKSR